MNAEYDAHLRSPAWAKLRKATLKRDRYRCIACEAREGLQVHHLTYERFGREALSDLTTLCEKCHKTLHDIAARRAGSIANPLGALFSQERAERNLRENPILRREAAQRELEARRLVVAESRERLRTELRRETAADVSRATALAAALGLDIADRTAPE